ncbi:zinc finger and BTB domain-containing protein 8B [Periophthalmus magnuspinnatus]|uniref:zinc finger and BTB domain-containing protein 8B n=1 Tax=Periophthalmus magnuspinnatus TaxID=409849 RepID=UPI00145BFE0D|nr:zinc finger and BTB domain-containing protein 8B [Periophthalmus magnuspinnatus]
MVDMEVPCYLPKLVADLNEQRKRDFFCDCSILVEGRVFKAHRNVLFAGSGYFRALLVHYIQDSGQRHCTASLDIVTADAFSIILDFMYSGRLDLHRNNVIEVMSAASYLQMTDLVNFCKVYINSSLEICNKERERNATAERQSKDKADSQTVTNSTGTMTSASQMEEDDADHGAAQSGTSAKTLPALSHNSPAGSSREVDSNFHIQEDFREEGHKENTDQTNLSSSSSSAMTPELVNPKIEYDPDEPVLIESPDPKIISTYTAQPHHSLHNNRLLPSSPPGERSPYSPTFSARHLIEMLARGEGPVPIVERDSPRFAPGLDGGAGSSRMDDGLSFVGSTMMETHSDWLGEDTGDSLVVQVKLHKCPFCPYTSKQKGILKRHIRSHTGERPFPCPLCGKRFTRQEHLRNHAFTVHKDCWPVPCKSCRRTFTGSAVTSGLKRYGLCDSCNCVTTTNEDSGHPVSHAEAGERPDGGADWSSFMDDVEEVEVGRVEDLVDRQLAGVCSDVGPV